MSKKYANGKTRSRRNSARQRTGKVKELDEATGTVTVQLPLPLPDILGGTYGAIESVATEAGLLIVKALVEEEVESLAGVRHQQDPGRRANRWGHEESYVVFGGRKKPYLRPRLRTLDGHELTLERFKLFQREDRMQEAVANQVVCGVSMRDYEKAIDGVCDGYGIRKSSVSRHWKAISAARLAEFVERPLGDLDLVAILVDGLEFHENLLVVALGVDSTGAKHVLGLWQGATENTEVCRSLLEDLVRRGLPTDQKRLFVLDGSKALLKAVRKVFGDSAEIQRCHLHKERNILEHLPKEHHRAVRMRLRAAWKMKDYHQAKAELTRLVRYLKDLNPSAARSLEEGFEETLTGHRLGLPETLRRSLRTTNAIESCFSTTRKYCRNVRHWRKGDMTMRWAGTMLLEAQKRFRRLKGYRAMPQLLSALGRAVDSAKAYA